MNATRRAILQAIGVSPVVAPSAAKQLAAIMAEPMASTQTVGLTSLNLSGSDKCAEGPMRIRTPLHEKVEDLVQKLYQEEEDRRWTGGKRPIDEDIAALRSVPPAIKSMMQRTRDNERKALIQAAHKFLSGKLI